MPVGPHGLTGRSVTEADGKALLRCLEDHFPSLASVHIDGADFRCFQGTSDAVVGTARSNKGRVMVARRTEEALILVMGDAGSHGSFLFELQKNLLERSQAQMAPQQQQQQQPSHQWTNSQEQLLPDSADVAPYPSVSQRTGFNFIGKLTKNNSKFC
ncbi:hypothetical protein C0Q70_17065 [Pomacea canaliculata]|uniref:Profilin n=1 Tax=Pomacea canaliculata TaxID=400727 RepID=A0A2T7NRI8_POMCA|nr:hypothetical protein C0Q70_17065 [Pomacea canaliculata]